MIDQNQQIIELLRPLRAPLEGMEIHLERVIPLEVS